MNRKYLTVPGQSVKVSISGPSGCGAPSIIQDLQEHFADAGLLVSGTSGEHSHAGYTESFTISCPSERQARDAYLASLSGHESATLQGHLKALGYEL